MLEGLKKGCRALLNAVKDAGAKAFALVVGTGVAVGSAVSAHAAPPDTTGVVTALTDMGTALAAVGAAIIAAAAIAVTYKWIKGMLFG
jgi:hypothetical protein